MRLTDADAEIATVSAAALGKIGSKKCAAPLREALAKAPVEQRAALAEACMAGAAGLRGSEATALFRCVEDADTNASIHALAWLARAKMSGTACVGEAAQAVKGDDRLLREAALCYLRETRGATATRALTGLLKNANPGVPVLVLAALSDRGDQNAAKEVLPMVTHAEQPVRIAAIKALAHMGTKEAIPVLLERAAHAEGAERDVARMSLDRLNAKGANAVLAKSADDNAPELRMETMRALTGRKAVKLVDVALNATADADPRVRMEAWKALKTLANKRSLPLMRERLNAAGDAERASAQDAVATVEKK
jgi:HEAT repeat protein